MPPGATQDAAGLPAQSGGAEEVQAKCLAVRERRTRLRGFDSFVLG